MYTEWTEEVRADFLKHLAETGSVSDAARLANVSRTHAYKLRAIDREFELDWLEAEALAEMEVEYEARRRALEIIEEPMLHRGALARQADGTPLTVRRYNDRMLLFLLKRLERRGLTRALTDRRHMPPT